MPANRFAALNQKPEGLAIAEPEPTVVVDQTTGQPSDRGTGKPKGKRSHPDFEKVGLYLHAGRRKRAERKWEDEGDGDFSDLIDKLLKDYLGDR